MTGFLIRAKTKQWLYELAAWQKIWYGIYPVHWLQGLFTTGNVHR